MTSCLPVAGVSNLRALLLRERDEDAPRLNMLLCESLVAVYVSLLVHALASYDANVLYRLVSHRFHENMWPVLFGGGLKQRINVKTTVDEHRESKRLARRPTFTEIHSMCAKNCCRTKTLMLCATPRFDSASYRSSPKDDSSRHRLKLHMKVMGASATASAAKLTEDKPTYREKFLSPTVSMLSYFMTKV